jgi:Zn-finger nucleic acid-binding protein
MDYRTASHPSGSCPRCVVELDHHTVQGMRVDACGKCGGVFAHSEMAKAIRHAPDRAVVDAVFTLSLGKQERPMEPTASELFCPECGLVMQRIPVTSAACDIDVCAEHGTWFDAHEFNRYVRALDQARARRHRY